jgi:hypothetical protein
MGKGTSEMSGRIHNVTGYYAGVCVCVCVCVIQPNFKTAISEHNKRGMEEQGTS